MLSISKGRINRAQKVVIYGSEGIGKSTLASQFPDPVFIDTEGGTAHMDVRRIEKPTSFQNLIEIVNAVATEKPCKTLVLDTADWAEQMCINDVCVKYKKAGIEEFGYGKGYTYVSEEFSKLLSAFDNAIAAGINVVVTAHAKMRKFELPDEMGAYDRWEMKLSKQTAPLLKEWCDMLLFLNYKTYVVASENNVSKAQGGKRVVYSSHHPCWDAKNRHNLPDEFDLSFEPLAPVFKSESKSLKELKSKIEEFENRKKLHELMEKDGVTEDQVLKVVTSRGHFEGATSIDQLTENFIKAWIIRYWDQVVKTIKEN